MLWAEGKGLDNNLFKLKRTRLVRKMIISHHTERLKTQEGYNRLPLHRPSQQDVLNQLANPSFTKLLWS